MAEGVRSPKERPEDGSAECHREQRATPGVNPVGRRRAAAVGEKRCEDHLEEGEKDQERAAERQAVHPRQVGQLRKLAGKQESIGYER